jgi:catechol 2,3-dioxygenase-like lactoylglutathione lyase family enzyme
MAGRIALKGLNHVAWRCIDAEQTRQFYEDLLSLPLAHVIRSDRVPSNGEYAPYCHVVHTSHSLIFVKAGGPR